MISYLDTQIVVWLCEGQLKKLTDSAAAAMEDYELVVSPIVLLELKYLYEIGRIVRQPLALLNQLENQLGLAVKDGALEVVIRSAMFETWTRDPFDRLIVGHAIADAEAILVTFDEQIQQNYRKALS